jgi:hypothetical protein
MLLQINISPPSICTYFRMLHDINFRSEHALLWPFCVRFLISIFFLLKETPSFPHIFGSWCDPYYGIRPALNEEYYTFNSLIASVVKHMPMSIYIHEFLPTTHRRMICQLFQCICFRGFLKYCCKIYLVYSWITYRIKVNRKDRVVYAANRIIFYLPATGGCISFPDLTCISVTAP